MYPFDLFRCLTTSVPRTCVDENHRSFRLVEAECFIGCSCHSNFPSCLTGSDAFRVDFSGLDRPNLGTPVLEKLRIDSVVDEFLNRCLHSLCGLGVTLADDDAFEGTVYVPAVDLELPIGQTHGVSVTCNAGVGCVGFTGDDCRGHIGHAFIGKNIDFLLVVSLALFGDFLDILLLCGARLHRHGFAA